MKTANFSVQLRQLRLMSLAALLLVAVGAAYGVSELLALRARQALVAERGAQVMPFNLERTAHTFATLPDGGLETVRALDPGDREQIALIQEHLQHEALKFSQGDFSDPAAIHGREMPGLAELAAGAERIAFTYTPLADGAQIRYRSGDPALVDAVHRWFEAQRADHGPHATEH